MADYDWKQGSMVAEKMRKQVPMVAKTHEYTFSLGVPSYATSIP